MKKNDKITIITATYNSEKTIEDTIKSVLSQTYKNYEHIIVDGKSTDNTLKIIKKYEKQYDGRLLIISEKDRGLYDAMNKGIKHSTGDIIGILNSDDKYYDANVLKKIVDKITSEELDGIYGDLLYVDETTMKIPKRKWISGVGKITAGWMPAHPTLYLTKKTYKFIGNYNLKYKIDADYDLIIRLFKTNNYNIGYINDYLVLMRLGGVSSNGIKGYLNNVKEAYKVLKENKVGFPYAFGIIVIRIFRTIMQMINAKFTKIEDDIK